MREIKCIKDAINLFIIRHMYTVRCIIILPSDLLCGMVLWSHYNLGKVYCLQMS